MKKTLIWLGALALGAIIGTLQVAWIDGLMTFVATAFTRLFQFVAVPTIALAVATTLATLGKNRETGRIFGRTLIYTFATTFAAALVGLGLYVLIAPDNLPASALAAEEAVPSVGDASYYDHILGVIPNNVIAPFASGNVLSILIIAMATGLSLAFAPESDGRRALLNLLGGLQELFNGFIRALIYVLPVGIVAFAAQLSAQVTAGVIVGSLGKYVAVIMGGNLLQFFVVLPLFLLLRGINPWKVFRAMTPAVLMALFTKSSAATLPVTIQSAEERLKASTKVTRFVLPICTTINMNGCAAFILVTSLFVMQHTAPLSLETMLLWVVLAVISAVGNAGVPMGCFFLTLSLMSGQGANVGILGIILPLYTVIDMVETAENVWSDSCVCAMVNKDCE